MTSRSSEHRARPSTGPSIDEIRDRFTARWQAGLPPQIEEFLGDAEGPERDRLLGELLTIELRNRRARHEQPDADEYHARFPEQTVVVDYAFGGPPSPPVEGAESTALDTFEEAPDATPVPPEALNVRCPVCQGHTPLVEGDSIADMTCRQCGSQFGLSVEDTQKHRPPTGVQVEQEQTLGHFRLEVKLGEGGFGAVWKAQDLQLDRAVAVKIPHRGRLGLAEADKFLREARAAAQLRHPNIVGIHDVGVDGQLVYIVSDFIEGSPLDRWLKDQKPGFCDSARLCLKICRALHHAHQQGIIHRDLKPSNIMIDAEGEPHIMDFGLAKRSAGEVTMTAEGTILGTPAYMSPEQARGEAHQADRRTDVYSLGVMLFEMVAGERPFRGIVQTLIRQVLEDEPPSPRKFNHNVPRDLETICLKCLCKEPPARYASAEELADELERYLIGVPIQARPVGALERLGRWCRRNPLVAASAATALVGLLFGLVALAVSNVQATRALQETRRAKARTEEALQETSQAQAKAEERLLFTKGAIDDLFTKISEETLLNQPGLQPLRRKLLQSAQRYYEEFLKESGDDPAIRDELALAYFRLGLITEEVESAGAAIGSYEEARDRQIELLAMQPEDASRLEALGDTFNALGRARQIEGGKLEQALEAYNAALEIRRRLSRRWPQSAEYQRLLANSTMNIGLLEKERNLERALEFLHRAQTIRRDALSAAPEHEALRRDLARGETMLADASLLAADALMWGEKRGPDDRLDEETERRVSQSLDAAEESFLRARELFEALAAENPEDLKLRYDLAVCLRTYAELKSIQAQLRTSQGKRKEAEPLVEEANGLYASAREVLAALAEKNPSVPEYQAGLAEVYMVWGQRKWETAFLEDDTRDPVESAAAVELWEKAYVLLRGLGDLRLEYPRYCRNFLTALGALRWMHPDPHRKRQLLSDLQAFHQDLAAAVEQSPEAAGLVQQLEWCRRILKDAEAEEALAPEPPP